MDICTYSKKLCMTELVVDWSHHQNTHNFDASAGKVNSSFGYIVNGSVDIYPIGNTLHVPTGSLFYVPNGVRYRSVWTGSPDIEQYCFHIVSKKYDISSTEFYPIQVIPELSTPETGRVFKEVYDLFSTEDRINKIKAISIYYDFYAKALPLLKSETPIIYSPVIVKAIDYIEKNYASINSTKVIADICHVSESRIYHVFQKELGTTPMQYRNEIRIEKAASELRRGTDSIDEIAFRNGFNSVSYFYEVFKAHTGMKPSDYRNTVKI